MIVYPAGFVLSAAAAGEPLDYTRILYENVIRDLPASSITVSSEAADGPADAPLRPDTASYWRAASMPATWLIDFGAFRDVDAVGVVGGLGSAGASIEVETSEDGIAWDPFSLEALPANDAPLLFLDTERSAHYLRITVAGSTPPRIAAIYVGKALVMQSTPDAPFTPPTLARVAEKRHSLSRGGHFLGQAVRRRGVATEISFSGLDQTWVRASFDPFIKAAIDYPYFIAWNPRAWPLEAAFAWTREPIKPPHVVAGLMQASWPIEGVGNE